MLGLWRAGHVQRREHARQGSSDGPTVTFGQAVSQAVAQVPIGTGAREGARSARYHAARLEPVFICAVVAISDEPSEHARVGGGRGPLVGFGARSGMGAGQRGGQVKRGPKEKGNLTTRCSRQRARVFFNTSGAVSGGAPAAAERGRYVHYPRRSQQDAPPSWRGRS